MVLATDHAPPCRTAYFSANAPPCDGSIQLNTAEPSGATDQFGCRLPAPAGLVSGVEVNVWLNAGSANKAAKRMDWIFTKLLLFPNQCKGASTSSKVAS